MKRLRRLAALAAVPFAFSTLSSSEALPLPKPYPVEVTAKTADLYRSIFSAAVGYWDEQGVPGMKDQRLVIVSGEDRVSCGPLASQIGSGDGSRYCPATNTTQLTARDIDTIGGRLALSIAVVGHEVGHGVQDAEGKLGILGMDTTGPLEEQEATCLAGRMALHEFPIPVMATMVSQRLSNHDITLAFGSDARHGTGGQQDVAFYTGFTTDNCQNYAS